MSITEDVRKYAEENGYGLDQVLDEGMAEMSDVFTSVNRELYSENYVDQKLDS